MIKKKLPIILGLLLSPVIAMFVSVVFIMTSLSGVMSETPAFASGVEYDGVYSEDLPVFPEIKGTANIPDEIAQLAVGTGVKYKLLPSVILSQYAYESEWGRSQSARNDINFFGITWFNGCPYPQGSSRGVGGSEGGNYMKFPNNKASFSYYGHMVASQSNFNASVGNKSPSEVLLILGRGGYAAAGITESSPYFTACLAIIDSNKLTQYDQFAMERWGQSSNSDSDTSSTVISNGIIPALERTLGQRLYNGQCYGLTGYYVLQMGGPIMMGSGFEFAQNIGTDYNWAQFGWQVILNPKPSDLKAGDVINWQAGGALAPGIYGHTGVIYAVEDNGVFHTYEQNAGFGQINAKYTRNYGMNPILSIVRKVK